MEPTLVVIGVSFRSAPVEVRERFWIDDARCSDALKKLARYEAVDEVALISTCNRTEFLVWTQDATQAANSVLRCLTREYNLTLSDWSNFYRYLDEAALIHVLRLASGLDSLVFGESNIATRIEFAYREGVQARTVGRCLEAVLLKSLAVARRVRTETEIASNLAASTSSPVELARQTFDSLNDLSIVVLGGGGTCERVAEGFRQCGIRSLEIVGHEPEREAKSSSQATEAPIPFKMLRRRLSKADLLVTCVPSARFLLQTAELEEVMRLRAGRRLVIIDLGVPRNVDPSVRELAGLTLCNMDQLNDHVRRSLKQQHNVVAQAERIVKEEVDGFQTELANDQGDPIVAEVRASLERLCREELERLNEEFGPFTEDQHRALNTLAGSIVQRISGSLAQQLTEPVGLLQQEAIRPVLRSMFASGSESTTPCLTKV